jgi:excisionase family DNA binding protein
MKLEPAEKLLTTQEVASRLHLATRTVCLWAECGVLPAFRVGRQWRFHASAIEQYVASLSGSPQFEARRSMDNRTKASV